MFKVYQITSGRWQITTTNPFTLQTLPTSITTALLWRSFQTEAEAQAFAATVGA